MTNILNHSVLIAILFSFQCTSREDKPETNESIVSFIQFSNHVKDTFHITVQVPLEYSNNPDKHYPAVFLLDGNFYFPMMSPVLHQYELTGLLPPMILVGVGYNSFKTMDSLRVRDYLYPKPLPSDEMISTGGGKNFNAYLTKVLLPKVDSSFRTDTKNRSLLGHSFGGYFVLYSLLNQLENESEDFANFISASPTLWYNNFYLNKIPQKVSDTGIDSLSNLNVFVGVGSMEDSVWSVKPVKDLTIEMQQADLHHTIFQSRIFNFLDHMDVGVLTFTKGLQEFFRDDE